MEKQKEEMRIEERDKRAEELQNQMFIGIPQDSEKESEENKKPEKKEKTEEKKVKEKEKKKDVQTSLFNF